MHCFMDFLIHNLAFIIAGGAIGWVWGGLIVLRRQVEGYSDFDFKYLQKDIERLKDAKWDLIKREEMILHTHQLFQRIAVLEARLEERKNAPRG